LHVVKPLQSFYTVNDIKFSPLLKAIVKNPTPLDKHLIIKPIKATFDDIQNIFNVEKE
jgi:hypothetical protein